jgi:tetratricopeptide (TPR) repeat protein
MAVLHSKLDNPAEYQRFSQEAEGEITKLVADFPEDAASVELAAVMHLHRCRQALSGKDYAKAEAALRSCVDAHRQVTKLDPDSSERLQARAKAQMDLASFVGNAGKTEEGLALLAEVEKMLAGDRAAPKVGTRMTKASVHWTRGDLYAAQKHAAEAAAAYHCAFTEYKALADDFPKTHSHRLVMAQLLISIGSAWKKAGDPGRGRPDLEKARELLDAIKRDHPDDAACRSLAEWAAELLQEISVAPRKTKS